MTRALTDNVIGALKARYGSIDVTDRDLADGMPFVDEIWVGANSTSAAARSKGQHQKLACSDRLIAELQAADVVIIGAPIYNFSVPAVLKAWIDMVARAGVTFRYGDSGPQGLLKIKKAYLAFASGGVAINSPVDFASPYLRHVLGFLGIHDVEVFGADQLGNRGDKAFEIARAAIMNSIRTSPLLQLASV